MNILDEINRVIESEIDALRKVKDGLDESYCEAAELMSSCVGKIVVTGMGKSGLIAKKIVATMISTGTPATFLHPSDGMHGDLGLIQKGDVAIAISKSGETEEILSVLAYLNKIQVPVISITCNSESTMVRNSDIVLFSNIVEEACPLNLAPTSSTTAALVVGDALSIVLMQMRGFSREEFALLHPGGRLGKRLLFRVFDVMRSGDDNPIVHVDETTKQLLYELTSKRCGAVSVIDEDLQLVGLVTDFDIRKNIEGNNDLFSLSISDIMNDHPVSIYSHELATTAMEVMRDRTNPFLVLPVLDEEKGVVVGMIHLHDMVAKGL